MFACEVCGKRFGPSPKDRIGKPRKCCSLRCALVLATRASTKAREIAAADYLWAKVIKGDACWEWQGTRQRRGYGDARHGGRKILAHRLSWEIHNGSIPAGMYVLHHCDNPPCVRPSHLYLGTHDDNMRDMRVRKRKQLTHCPNGHEISGTNEYIRSDYGHRCRICTVERHRQRRALDRLEKSA